MTSVGLPQEIGRFRLGRVLGHGGFATVVKAFDEGLRSHVAIKILDQRFVSDEDITHRFKAEGQLLRRVDHPNVVSVHDVGELDDGRPYYVMQFAEGGVLAQRMPAGPGLVPPEDLRRMIDALEGGVGALHQAGVVHRDIKPGNLLIGGGDTDASAGTAIRRDLLSETERLLIGDLGLAKAFNHTSIGGSPSGNVEPTVLGGSLHFRAPEQSQLGAEITPAADVFAATGVLWNLLTGTPPPGSLELEAVDVGIPTAWQEFFRQGLSQRPEERFNTIERWGDASREALAAASEVGFSPVASGAICPFKGLAAFQPEDAQFFFGRERLIDELTARLQANSVLVIGGSSGSGKSSLLRAGLMAALSKGSLPGSQTWQAFLFTPGSDPMGRLDRQLVDLPTPSQTVATGAVIAIDQFEEAFTSTSDPTDFIARIAQISDDHQGRVRIVIAVRADFYGDCSEHPWLADAINRNSVLVGPLRRAELRAAVEGPTRRAGLGVEAGLVDKILEQAPEDSGALPLIAHALMETWLRRRNDVLTINGLEAAGGVGGAIAQTADHTFEQLGPPSRDMMERLFLDLVNPGDNSPDTRRQLDLAEVQDDPKLKGLIDTLVDARLLTVGTSSVELAHEALITTWPRFRGWIDSARDDLRFRERIERAAAAWEAENRDPGLLYRGRALAVALESHGSTRLSSLQQRFLDESLAAESAERELAEAQERKRQRLRRAAVSSLTVLTALALVASALAFRNLRRAQENEQQANARFLEIMGNQAKSLQTSDPLAALMLATESTVRREETSWTTQKILAEARLAVANAGVVPLGSPIQVPAGKAVAMHPNGMYVAVGARAGEVHVIAVEDRSIITAPPMHSKGVEDVAFSPDGRWLASSDTNGAVWLWDTSELAPGRAPSPMTQPALEAGTQVWGLAFSPDSSELAVTTEDGRLIVGSVASGTADATTLWTTDEDLLSVAFAPDGASLALGSGTGSVSLIDRSTGRSLFETQPHSSDVWQVDFTPDGSEIVSASTTTVSQSATSGEVLGPVFHTAGNENNPNIRAVAALPDGLVVGGSDRGELWLNTRTQDGAGFGIARVLSASHETEVADAGMDRSRNGSMIASLSGDGVVRLWSVSAAAPPLLTTTGRNFFGSAQSRDGTSVALGSDDGSVVVVDLNTFEIKELTGHSGAAFGVSAVADGWITGDAAGTLRKWSTSGQLQEEVQAHRAAVTGVASSPGSDWVASAAEDGTVRMWDHQLGAVADAAEELAGGATAVAMDPSGDYVAVAGRAGQLRLWNGDGTARTGALQLDDNTLWDVAISPDGDLLATASANEQVQVWRTGELTSQASAGPLHELTPQARGAIGVAFGLTSDVLYTTNRTGEVRIWNPLAGESLSPALPLLRADAWALAVSPVAESAVVAGPGGQVFLVDLLDLDRSCELTSVAADEDLLSSLLGGESRTACLPAASE